jgi:hypothetical protein
MILFIIFVLKTLHTEIKIDRSLGSLLSHCPLASKLLRETNVVALLLLLLVFKTSIVAQVL